MPADARGAIRCAVYTRKSSDEGLEQSFNSLDAQREACVAYIVSQKHEGWKVIDTQYDDGGYSGGSMERPALKQLLSDIDAGKIDTVVVYKVDRLTRSLTDFAKIVETFDAHGVSFVSITQHFNTTTSMGRLTLNVLLSFAQFEREVTGERIRDKIAASKRKGMWMGGYIPLGYDVRDRKLVVNHPEAEVVRGIYGRYLKLGCVRMLKDDLDTRGIKSKLRVAKTGGRMGGLSFSRGALYRILTNRLYLGEITHRGKAYPGEHEAIVPVDVWDKAQVLLKSNRQAKRQGLRAKEPSLLAGILFDGQGNRLTPSHAAKNGKRYRYYVSQALIQHCAGGIGMARRIPAHDIEGIVKRRLQAFLGSASEVSNAIVLPGDDAQAQKTLTTAAKHRAIELATLTAPDARAFLLAVIVKVAVHEESVEILVSKPGLRAVLNGEGSKRTVLGAEGNNARHDDGDVLNLTVDARLKRCGREMRLILPGAPDKGAPARLDVPLIKAIARGYSWYERLISGKTVSVEALAAEVGLNKRYVNHVIRCALLAPDIVERILEGRQPPELTLNRLFSDIPMDWAEQRRIFGISAH